MKLLLPHYHEPKGHAITKCTSENTYTSLLYKVIFIGIYMWGLRGRYFSTLITLNSSFSFSNALVGFFRINQSRS